MRKIDVVMSTAAFGAEHLKHIKEAFAPAEFISLDPKDVEGIRDALQRADVAIVQSDLDERYLEAPKLKWIHCCHAGLNKSAYPKVFEKELLVTSSAGRGSIALAEHAMFFMLSLTYNFPALYNAQQHHIWLRSKEQEGLTAMYGKTLGILGMGNTGRELALRAKAFGMKVLAYRRRDTNLPAGVDEVFSADKGESPDRLLGESDFIVLAMSLSDATYQIIGDRELGLMKPSAFLINMARGELIDEKALVQALREHKVAGAGLDAFAEEPLPYGNPLWNCPGVIITPHSSPKQPDGAERIVDILCLNLKNYLEDRPMINLLKAEDVYTRGR